MKMIQELEEKLRAVTGGTDPAFIPIPRPHASTSLSVSAPPSSHIHPSANHDVALGLLQMSGNYSIEDGEQAGVAQFLEAASPAERLLDLDAKGTAAAPPPGRARSHTASHVSSEAREKISDGDQFELPAFTLAKHLVDWYEAMTMPILPIILWDDFHARFERTWTPSAPENRDRLWLATLNLVFAFSSQIQLVGGDSRHKPDPALAHRFFARSQRLLSLPQMMALGGLPAIQAVLLVGQFAMSSSQADLTGNSIALALSMARRLNLHRVEAEHGLSERERELRRRVWAGCVAQDRHVPAWPLRLFLTPRRSLSSAMLGHQVRR
jgi:hypothetical protein